MQQNFQPDNARTLREEVSRFLNSFLHLVILICLIEDMMFITPFTIFSRFQYVSGYGGEKAEHISRFRWIKRRVSHS